MKKDRQRERFSEGLAEIRARLLAMGGELEPMIRDSVRALVERDSPLAERAIALDAGIVRLESEVDRQCRQLLVMDHHPESEELRFVAMAMKVVTDLERIGDQCASIAKHALALNGEPQLKPYLDLPLLAETVTASVRQALEAFVHGDAEAAARVCRDDRQVDELSEQIQRVLLTFMMEDAGTVPRAMRINSISKYLAKIADHATDIAAMAIIPHPL